MSNPDPSETGSRAASLAAGLRRKIAAGSLGPGARMPSVRALAKASDVSPFTAARVYDVLVAEGLVEARRGSGYFVAQNTESLRARPPAAPELPADSIWLVRREYDPRMVRVDAGCGWLPPDWLFADGVRSALTRVAQRPTAHAGRYGSPHGLRSLRRHLVSYMAQRGIACSEDQVVLVQGASQGLELCIRVLTRPGDSVLVDDPCYPYLLEMLRSHGVKPVGVPRTSTGPDVEALNEIALTARPRVFFTNTTLQNPTGTTTTPSVAHAVLSAADRYDFTIVEDDISSELAPVRTANLASLDGLRRVLYVSSFSKAIAPNLRVGYVVARDEAVQTLLRVKTITSLSSSELSEQLVLSILTAGRHRTHLERLRQRLAAAQEKVSRRLTQAGAQLTHRTDSGMFLWARLPSPLDSRTIMQHAKAKGILLAPGELFRPDGRSTGHFRFNVAYADSELLYAFIDRLLA
ncbi:MAG TPA: PLP-dependent aminotransferase family protein [Steroidobacteraceae bacterium]|nr:PLP-dependent aminotransferase family protein [Steroidobacteraceae bacterium]